MRFRLRWVLAAAFVVVALLPVGMLAVWVKQTAYDRELAEVRERHLLIARNLTGALERFARDVTAGFLLYCQTRDAGFEVAEPIRTLHRQLGFRYFLTIDGDGRILRSVAVDGEGEAPASLAPELAALLWRDAPESSIGFSRVVHDHTGQPTIFLRAAGSGGLLDLGALSPDYIVQRQQAVTFGKLGHAAVVDQKGHVLAHPRDDWRREMKNIAGVEPVGRMMAGETGVAQFYSPAIKADMITGFAAVAGPGWGVMVPQPLSELRDRAFEVARLAAVVAVAGLLVAALLGLLVARLLTRPLERAVRAADAIQGGDLGARAVHRGRLVAEEPRQLIEGFNAMADRLESDSRRLRLALERARLADRAKSEFLANMSHELRTPLNAVIGFADVMRNQLFGPLGDRRYVSYAEDIAGSGSHLLGIINDILDLSRIEQGRMEVDKRPLFLREIAEAAMEAVRERAEGQGLTLDVTLPGDLPPVLGSAEKLHQILANLLSNAVKFTPAGGSIVLTASAVAPNEPAAGSSDCAAAARHWLAISVADNGIGMSKADLALALEPFGQVDSRLSRRFEGAGLGLPLVRRLVELQGGRLEIESERGCGTRVTVLLPAVVAPHAVPAARSAARRQAVALGAPGLGGPAR